MQVIIGYILANIPLILTLLSAVFGSEVQAEYQHLVAQGLSPWLALLLVVVFAGAAYGQRLLHKSDPVKRP